MIQNQRRQNHLRIFFDQPGKHGWVNQLRRIRQEHRNERKHKVQGPANDGTGHRDTLGARRHHPLKHVLLRYRTEHDRDGRTGKSQYLGGRWLRPERELARTRRMINHHSRTTSQIRYHVGDIEQTDHDDDHLKKIRQRHRPHATEECVDQHDRRSDHHAARHRDRALRQNAQHQPKRGDLRGNPAQIGNHDTTRHDDFNRPAVTLAVVIANREQIHPVEFAGEKQAHKNQAQRRAKGIFNHTTQAAISKFGRNTEHSFRPKPGRKDRRNDDIRR